MPLGPIFMVRFLLALDRADWAASTIEIASKFRDGSEENSDAKKKWVKTLSYLVVPDTLVFG